MVPKPAINQHIPLTHSKRRELNDAKTGTLQKKSDDSHTKRVSARKYITQALNQMPYTSRTYRHRTHESPPHMYALSITSKATENTYLVMQIPQTHIRNRHPSTYPYRQIVDQKAGTLKRKEDLPEKHDIDVKQHTHNPHETILSPTPSMHQKHLKKTQSTPPASEHERHSNRATH